MGKTVEVTAATPLLDTTTASGGRVIDNRQVLQLPFLDMNNDQGLTFCCGLGPAAGLSAAQNPMMDQVTDPKSTNFGKVTTQCGLSRLVQFNLRLEF